MRTAADVVSRVRWDPTFDQDTFTVGYLDRFLGVQEKPFSKFQWTKDFHNILQWDSTVLEHRIMYFKYRGVLVWDKDSRLDLIFQSSVPQDAKYKSLADIDAEMGPSDAGAGAAAADTAPAVANKRRPRKPAAGEAARPSHFICWRITDPTIIANVQRVQQALVETDSRLEAALVPQAKLHVTLCTLLASSQEELDAVSLVMHECQQELNSLLPPTASIGFDGVDSFGGRVVIGKVQQLAPLMAFQQALVRRLRLAGISLAGTRDEYVPHMTLMKLDQKMASVIDRVPSVAHRPFASLQLGSQAIKGIHFCAMALPAGSNGFYHSVCSVRNAPVVVDREEPVPPATMLLRQISDGGREGWLDSDSKQVLKARILTAAPQALTAVASELAEHRARHTAAPAPAPAPASALAPAHVAHRSDAHIPPPAMLARRTSELVRQGRVPATRKAELQDALAAGRASFGQAIATLSSIMGAVADSDDDDDAVETKSSDDAGVTADVHVEGGDRICGHPGLLLSPEDAASQLRALVPAGRPIAIILRGLPGSGKSHFAHSMAAAGFDTAIVCSADDFFMRGGKYSFDASKLGAAHASCQRKFIEAMYDKAPVVIVDNTNTTAKEYAVYQQLAAVFDYMVAVVAFICPDLPTLRVFAQRNQHGVQQTHLEKMWRRMKVVRTDIAVRPWLPQGAIEQAAKVAARGAGHASHPHLYYVAVFLRATSRAQLLATMLPKYRTIAADHVTLAFEPPLGSVTDWPIGRTVRVQVLGCFSNDRIQAAPVRLDGVESSNKVPHITISYVPSAQARESNDLLEEIKEDWSTMSVALELEGVVGLCPRTGVQPMTSAQEVREWAGRHADTKPAAVVEQPLRSVVDAEEVKDGRILHVFDFDSTLFMTPDADVGVQILQKLTGQVVSTDGWLRAPESLLPPMVLTPGPALPDYFLHAGRDRTVTVILTGRTSDMLETVRRVAADFGVSPDRIITKPRLESSSVYKPFALRSLLTELQDIKLVKIWDDDVDCIEAYRLFASSLPGVRFDIHHVTPYPAGKLSADVLLQRMGRASSDAHAGVVQQCMRTLEEGWGRVVREALPGHSRRPLRQLCHLFGSSLVGGVSSDMDVCILAPESLRALDCCERLRSLLVGQGIHHTDEAVHARVAKLRFRLIGRNHMPIDVDCLFSSVPDDALFADWPLGSIAALHESMVKRGDDVSAASLLGLDALMFWQQSLAMPCVSWVPAVISVCRLVLEARRLKGNHFHCVRSFHIMDLLQRFVAARGAAAFSTGDQLLKAFLGHIGRMSVADWKRHVGSRVPEEWLPHVVSAFAAAADAAAAGDFAPILQRTPFPPASSFTVCELVVVCDKPNVCWQLTSAIHARLPTYIRGLLASQVQLVPNGCAGEPLEFAFRNVSGSGAASKVRSAMQDLVRDLDSLVLVGETVAVHVRFNKENVVEWTKKANTSEPFAGLPDSIKSLLQDFQRGTQSELELPSSLTAEHRRLVHTAATRLGWSHVTRGHIGVGRGRVMVLSK